MKLLEVREIVRLPTHRKCAVSVGQWNFIEHRKKKRKTNEIFFEGRNSFFTYFHTHTAGTSEFIFRWNFRLSFFVSRRMGNKKNDKNSHTHTHALINFKNFQTHSLIIVNWFLRIFWKILLSESQHESSSHERTSLVIVTVSLYEYLLRKFWLTHMVI